MGGGKADKSDHIKSEWLAQMSVNANWSSNDVWIQSTEKPYEAAKIVERKGNNKLVVELKDKRKIEIDVADAYRINPPEMDGIDDMANLTHLNEAGLLYNLEYRYNSGYFYTNSGLFLIAVNPYKNLDLYSNAYIEEYRTGNIKYFKPHIFAVAEGSYRAMIEDKNNQSILITGESGAGKTENTKKVIQYITAVASKRRNKSDSNTSSRRKDVELLTNLEQSILVSNTILEAFGNAQTVKNDNSSRFGKSICIEFDKSQRVCGGCIKWYLLEKSRVTHTSIHERSFHIFYQFMKGASKELKEKFFITGDITDYDFIKNTKHSIPGVNDSADFNQLLDAMAKVGFTDDNIEGFFRLISAILHLGQINFIENNKGTDFDSPRSKKACELACMVLGVPTAKFIAALLQPSRIAGKDVFVQSVSAAQAKYSIESIAAATYESLFATLVNLINKCMASKTMTVNSIIVLDISGFEILETNSFEQLCINLSNEKLQQFFNHHMFIKEQAEYQREGIEWNYIDFKQDLQPTIDLIEGKDGVFRCLDTLCFLQSSTDEKFLSELNNECGKKSSKFVASRFGTGFILKHYAGDVKYDTTGWIDKNRDPVNLAILKCLANSSVEFVSSVFSNYNNSKFSNFSNDDGKFSQLVKKGQFHTISQIHREQLNTLSDVLSRTNPFFVRCILPNREKKSDIFDGSLVAEQLRCNGVYEGLRSLRSGYPSRIPFMVFAKRYGVLLDNFTTSNVKDPRSICVKILNANNVNEDRYCIGNSKVLMRVGVVAELEEKKNVVVTKKVTITQAYVRGWLARKEYKHMIQAEESATILQNNIKAFIRIYNDPWWKLYVRLKPLISSVAEEKENAEMLKEIDRLETSLQKEIADKAKTTSLLREAVNREKDIVEKLDAATAELSTKREAILGLSEKVSTLEENLSELNTVCVEKDKALSTNLALKKQIEALNNELNAIKKTNGSNVIKISALEKSEVSLREQLNQAVSTSNRIAAELSSERNALDKATLDLSKYENLENFFKIERAKLTDDNTILSNENDRLKTDVSNLSKDVYALKQDKQKVEEVASKLKNELETINSKYAAIENERDDIKHELSVSTNHLTQAGSKIESLSKDNEQLNSKINSLNKIIEQRYTAETRQNELVRMRDVEIAELKDKILKYKNEYDNFRNISEKSKQELITKNDAAVSSIKKYNAVVAKLKDKISEHEKEIESISQEKMDLNEAMSENKNKINSMELEIYALKSNEKLLDEKNKEMSKLLAEKTADSRNVNCSLKRTNDKCALLEKEVHNSDAKIIKLESELNASRAEYAKIKSKYDELEKINKDLEHKLASLKDMYDENIVNKVNEVERKSDALRDELKHAKSDLNSLNRDIGTLKIENAELEKRNKHLIGENEDLKVSLNKDQQLIDTLTQKLTTSDNKLNSFIKESEHDKRNHSSLVNELETAKRDLNDANANVNQQAALIKMHQTEKKEYSERLDSIINQLTDNDRNINDLEENNRQIKKELQSAKRMISHLEESLKKSNEEQLKIREEYESMLQKDKIRLSSIESDYANLGDTYNTDIGNLEMTIADLEREVQKQTLLREHMAEKLKEYENSSSTSGAPDTEYYENIKKTYENRVAGLTEKLTEVNRKEVEGREKLRRMENSVRELTTELSIKNEELENTMNDLTKCKHELISLKEKLALTQSEAKVNNEIKEGLNARVVDLTEKLRASEKRLNEHVSDDAESNLNISKQKSLEIDDKIKQLRNAETVLLLKIKSLESAVHDRELNNKILDDKCSLLTKRIERCNVEIEKERELSSSRKTELDDALEKYSQIKIELDNANSCIEEYSKSISTLNAKNKKISDRLSELESAVKIARSDNTHELKISSLEIEKDNLQRAIQMKDNQLVNFEKKLKYMTDCQAESLDNISQLSQENVELASKIDFLEKSKDNKIDELNSKIIEIENDSKRELDKLKGLLEIEKSFTESHRQKYVQGTSELQITKAKLSEALRAVDDLTKGKDIIQESNSKLISKCKNLEASCRNINDYLSQMGDKNTNLRSKVLHNEKAIEEMKNNEELLISQRDQYMSDVSKLKMEVESSNELCSSLRNECDVVKNDNRALNEKVDFLTKRLESKEKDSSELKSKLQEITTLLAESNEQKVDLEREIAQLNHEVQSISNVKDTPMAKMLVDINKSMDEKTVQVNQLQDNIFQKTNEIRAIKRELIEYKGKLDLEQKINAEMKREKSELMEKLKVTKQDTDNYKNLLKDKEIELRDSVNKIDNLTEKVAMLSALSSNYKDYDDSQK